MVKGKGFVETANWQDAVMTSGDFGDDMLQFLGSFEEVLPEGFEAPDEKPKTKKKQKKMVKKESDVTEEDGEEKTVDEKRLLRKQKRKEQMAINKKLKKERLARQLLKKQNGEEESKKEEQTEKEVAGKKRKAKNDSNDQDKKKSKKNSTSKESETEVASAVSKTDISAWKEFYFLPQPVLEAISDLGFAEPTDIQSAVLPVAVRDRQDVLGAAETGSGKTLAFGIPMIARLLEADEILTDAEKSQGPRALIIAPTRELVIQIMKHVDALIKHTKLKAITIVGGLAQVKQERIIAQRCPDIVVATPGRLWAMMENAESTTYLGNWSNLRCLVVDETDRMVEEGYFNELTYILSKVHEDSNKEKLQTLVFSATLTFARTQANDDDKKKTKELSSSQKIQRLIKLTGLRENKHKVIDLTRQMGTAGCLVEARINCENLLEKDTALVYLLSRYPGRTIVFVNSIDAARRLTGVLQNIGMAPMVLHAKMIQKQRLKNLEKFTESKNAVLLATDVAARGLDIKGIDHVIHYQVPKKVEIYIHRSGRTARASQRGLTVLLVDPPSKQFYLKLCKGLNRMEDLNVFPIDFEPLMDAISTRVKLASEIDALSFRCKKIKINESWFEKAAREADLDYDDMRTREMDGYNNEVDNMVQRTRKLQAELREELKNPLPKCDGSDTIRTKYITPDIIAKLNSVGDNAIDVLHQKMKETKEWKRKSRQDARKDNLHAMKKTLKNDMKKKEKLGSKTKKNTKKVFEESTSDDITSV